MKTYPQRNPMPAMSKMRFVAAMSLLLLPGTFSSAGAVVPVTSAVANNIFVPMSQGSISAQQAERASQRENWVTRHRPCGVDFAILKKARDAEISSLRFDLFDGISLDGEIEETIFRSDRSYTLVGSLKGAISGDFILSIHEGILAGNIRTTDGSSYQVRYRPEGFHETRIIDDNEFPECGVGPEHHVAESDGGIDAAPNNSIAAAFEEPSVAADDGTLFDVLVVYTPAARGTAGGHIAMEALINLAIAETNVAYANSSITSLVRLVHQQEIAYTESIDMFTDLVRLQDMTDGFMDEVHSLRDTHGADLVVLLSVSGQFCGVAFLMKPLSSGFEALAFSVTAWDCATGNYTFAHELGHNMGCHHAVGDGNPPTAQGDGLNNYSHGWRFNYGPNTYRTIMASSPGTRIQHFSNPDVNFIRELLRGELYNVLEVPTGRALGETNEANNALSINNAASTISNWRQSVSDCDTLEPDNTAGQASVINSGVFQTHSIIPAADVDWVRFTLSEESEVIIETSGASGDTRMWLFNSGLAQIEFDDDDGAGTFSRIDRLCNVDALPAGTYFVKIDEFGNNTEIACYAISLTVESCIITVVHDNISEEPVHFADANLKAAVETELGVTDPNTTDMLSLITLDASSLNIKDPNGLQYAKNLQTLDLSNNQLNDPNIYVLSGLTNLQSLDLGRNFNVDPKALRGLINLQTLSLGINLIRDPNALVDLINLETLDLHSNQISDITPLAGLTSLTNLLLQSNPLNTAAYCRYLPMIGTNNPGINLQYDQPNPNPLTVDCSISLAELVVFAGHWLESGCGVGNNWCGGADLIHSGYVGVENFVELSNYY